MIDDVNASYRRYQQAFTTILRGEMRPLRNPATSDSYLEGHRRGIFPAEILDADLAMRRLLCGLSECFGSNT
jgi:hypothetical protein